MNVSFLNESDFKSLLRDSIKDLNTIRAVKGKTYTSASTTVSGLVQKYTLLNIKNANHENIIKPIILDAIFRSENIAEGSGDICLNIFLNNIEKFLMEKATLGPRNTINNINNVFKQESSLLIKNIKRFNRSHLDIIVDNVFSSNIQKEIVKKALSVSSPRSKIIVEKSNKNNTAIKVQKGYIFNIPVSMSSFTTMDVWSNKDVSTIVIDGMIENISEIHHLLEVAASNNRPYTVFARSASEDVRNTISVNNARGTINVALVEVGFDENTLNILNDISICCNSRLISSNFGDLISSAVKDDMVQVDKISISGKQVTIQNKADESKIKSHIAYLDSKKNVDRNLEISHIFDSRIRSLTSDSVTIRIGKDLILNDPSVIERFDRFLRTLRSHIRNDTVIKSEIESKIIKDAISKNNDIVSFDSAYFSLRNSLSLIKSIISIDTAITNDKH